LGAQRGPFLFQHTLIRGDHGTAFGEFLAGDLQQFSQIDFLGLLADQMTIKHQLSGIAFLLNAGLQLAVNGTLAQDGIDYDRPAGVQAVNPVDGLLKFVEGPGITEQHHVVAQRKGMAFGHGIHPGEHDLIGGTTGAKLELCGHLATTPGTGSPVTQAMRHADFGQAGSEDVQGIMEGAEHHHLFAFGQTWLDELEGAMELGDVGLAGARLAGCLEIPVGPNQQLAGRIGGGHAQRLQLRADGRATVFVAVLGLQMKLVYGGLLLAHGRADDMAGLGDDVLAEIPGRGTAVRVSRT
jgi:hypothetical protein